MDPLNTDGAVHDLFNKIAALTAWECADLRHGDESGNCAPFRSDAAITIKVTSKPLGPRKNSLIRCCPLCRGTGHASEADICFVCGGDGHLARYNPYLLFRRSPWIRGLLASVIEVSGAEFGNLQLFDSKSESLKIVAQRGFKGDFLSFFGQVHDGASACGAAMKDRSRILVSDVASDPIFRHKEPGEVILRAGVNAVQSTPLIAPSGNVIGIVSTHYKRPRTFSPQLLKEVDAVCASFTRDILEERKRSKQTTNPVGLKRAKLHR